MTYKVNRQKQWKIESGKIGVEAVTTEQKGQYPTRLTTCSKTRQVNRAPRWRKTNQTEKPELPELIMITYIDHNIWDYFLEFDPNALIIPVCNVIVSTENMYEVIRSGNTAYFDLFRRHKASYAEVALRDMRYIEDRLVVTEDPDWNGLMSFLVGENQKYGHMGKPASSVRHHELSNAEKTEFPIGYLSRKRKWKLNRSTNQFWFADECQVSRGNPQWGRS